MESGYVTFLISNTTSHQNDSPQNQFNARMHDPKSRNREIPSMMAAFAVVTPIQLIAVLMTVYTLFQNSAKRLS
jgi:hypothetical protein